MEAALIIPAGAVVVIVFFVLLVGAVQRSARRSGRDAERRDSLERGSARVDKFLDATAQAPPSDPRDLAARFRLLGK